MTKRYHANVHIYRSAFVEGEGWTDGPHYYGDFELEDDSLEDLLEEVRGLVEGEFCDGLSSFEPVEDEPGRFEAQGTRGASADPDIVDVNMYVEELAATPVEKLPNIE